MHLPVVIGTVPYRRLSPYLMQSRLYQDASTEYFGTQYLPAPPPYRETPTPPPPFDGRLLKLYKLYGFWHFLFLHV